MPRIKSKVIRVKDPDGIWHDLPAVVSEEAMEAAERANQAAQTAQGCIAAAEAAAEEAESYAEQAREWTPEAVNAWLDAHPDQKIQVDELGYVTPQMYGAKGDGITDDTEAFEQLTGKTVFVPQGTYIVSHVEFGSHTAMFGAGMGKSIIKQKAGETRDLFDFVDADSSRLVDLALYGQTNEISNDIYRALLKIRVTSNRPTNRSHYSNYDHLLIREAPGSGLVIMGKHSEDPVHPDSDWNWVIHFNDIRVEVCHLWCMIDESTDNRFSNFYLDEGELGNFLCRSGANMYENFKLDQPYTAGRSGHLEGYDDGALLLLKDAMNDRFINLDLQSAAYVGAKIYKSHQIHFDGSLNNCGIFANGNGIGILAEESTFCTFVLSCYGGTTPQRYNVKINQKCKGLTFNLNQFRKTPNPNACEDSCYIIEQSSLTQLYNPKIENEFALTNIITNPLIQSLDGWSINQQSAVSLDTNSKTVGTNSLRIQGTSSQTVMISQSFADLVEGDTYVMCALVNVDTLPTSYTAETLRTPYLNLYNGSGESRIYVKHNTTPASTGKKLIMQVGVVDANHLMQARIMSYQNDGIYYVGNVLLFNAKDIGISLPAGEETYDELYNRLNEIKETVFDAVNLQMDYTQIIGLINYLLQKEVQTSEITTGSATIAAGKLNPSSFNVDITKQGNIVIVKCEAFHAAEQTSVAWGTLMNIEEGFRPTENTYFTGFYGTDAWPFVITTTGNVQTLKEITGTSRIGFTVSYIVE